MTQKPKLLISKNTPKQIECCQNKGPKKQHHTRTPRKKTIKQHRPRDSSNSNKKEAAEVHQQQKTIMQKQQQCRSSKTKATTSASTLAATTPQQRTKTAATFHYQIEQSHCQFLHIASSNQNAFQRSVWRSFFLLISATYMPPLTSAFVSISWIICSISVNLRLTSEIKFPQYLLHTNLDSFNFLLTLKPPLGSLPSVDQTFSISALIVTFSRL